MSDGSPFGLEIPPRLARACRAGPRGAAWLDRLPVVVAALVDRWGLTLGRPFPPGDGAVSWVAPAVRHDGSDVVLKVGMPHMEARDEVAGLRMWDGDGTVHVLDAYEASGAMLLERCRPGSSLRAYPEEEQDVVIARALQRLWREPTPPHPFRPLADMTAYWADAARRRAGSTAARDRKLLDDALDLYTELPHSTDRQVLLVTDLHAGNVLRAEREPWLVIDPKPFVGDPAFDATQHLLNTRGRLERDPLGTIGRMAGLLGVDAERVRAWTFARLALGGIGGDPAAARALARRLAP